ncbi:hypothetical protein [Enhygromyxa salina]|uniref:hypothetical protein n=1 Tax=Enhygromyxa salina TaxID=215803 RepID=UPI0015E5F240|nr:hypothetical protein [Enhygromyxa salina]
MHVQPQRGVGALDEGLTWTDDEGHFSLPFEIETLCPNQDATLVVSSFHEPAPFPISVFWRSAGATNWPSFSSLLLGLTDDASDYTVPYEILAVFKPGVEGQLPGRLVVDTLVGEQRAQQSNSRDLDVAIHLAHAMRDSLDYWGQ